MLGPFELSPGPPQDRQALPKDTQDAVAGQDEDPGLGNFSPGSSVWIQLGRSGGSRPGGGRRVCGEGQSSVWTMGLQHGGGEFLFSRLLCVLCNGTHCFRNTRKKYHK